MRDAGALGAAAAWQRARRILAVRVDNLGDVLMTTPALAAIKQTLPHASLTMLASASGATLAPHLPMVDDWIVVRAPWVKHSDGQPADDPQRIAQEMSRRRFDGVIIFTTYTQSALPAALLSTFARIPLRLAHVRENPYDLLTHWVRDPEPAIARHEVERQLALVATIGMITHDDRLRFVMRTEDRTAARQRLGRHGVAAAARYAVVHPGASAPSRRYPAERFGMAARVIAQHLGCAVAFVGSTQDREAVTEALRQAGNIPSAALVGELSVGELAALIADSTLILCNNSGPAHLAAAVGTPVVDLYALTNLQHTPWRVASRVLNRDVPCRNCFSSVCTQGHHLCLRGVAPEEVADAALSLLAQPAIELSAA